MAMTTTDAAELAERLLQTFTSGDIEGLKALHAPDCVWEHYGASAGLRGRYTGIDGITAHLGRVQERIELTGVEVDSIMSDGETAVALLQISGTAKTTGSSFSGPEVMIVTARDGTIARMQIFPSEGDEPWTG